ncbi:unnamed protein product [Echinostoma caproni]|uniref:Uncharacterized protein n=1 Tax=Echinostoma caproni TaxID=27848 RepID=A0A183B9J2_9TREM|nr:unnamed protein product [Echinostoma caproni]
MQREAKHQYENKLARDIKTKPERFFAYVQFKGTTRASVGTLEMANGNIASTDKDRDETLMDYFKSIYRSSQCDGAWNPLVDTIGNDLQMLIVSGEKLRAELKSLSKHKGTGPNEIHPAIVQPLAEFIPGPVTDLFKASLNSGVVPEDWRKTTVVAIYKTGSRQKAENYRPILLPRGESEEALHSQVSRSTDGTRHYQDTQQAKSSLRPVI